MLEEDLKPRLHILEGIHGPRVVAFCDGPDVRDVFEVTRDKNINLGADLIYCQTYGQRNCFEKLVKCGVPYVVHVGGDIWNERQETKAARSLPDVSRCMRRATAVVCIGKFLAGMIAANLGSNDNIVLLPGGLWGTDKITKGVDPSRFKSKKDWAIRGQPLVVMNINVMVKRKWQGVLIFLNAVANVVKERGIRIVWVSRVGRRTDVVDEVQDKYDIEVVPPSDKWAELLNAADLFVHPSMFDGFPRSLAESCCAALPALAFDVAGGREVSKCVTLCDPFSNVEIVEKFVWLLDNEKERKRIGKAARKDAVKKTREHRPDYAKLLLGVLEGSRE